MYGFTTASKWLYIQIQDLSNETRQNELSRERTDATQTSEDSSVECCGSRIPRRTVFQTNVVVFKLIELDNGKTTAELIRRSMCRHSSTLNVNLYDTHHYSYIRDVKMFCHSYRCSKCGKYLWTTSILLRRHEKSCHGGVRYVYPGGVYHPKPSVFKQLED